MSKLGSSAIIGMILGYMAVPTYAAVKFTHIFWPIERRSLGQQAVRDSLLNEISENPIMVARYKEEKNSDYEHFLFDLDGDISTVEEKLIVKRSRGIPVYHDIVEGNTPFYKIPGRVVSKNLMNNWVRDNIGSLVSKVN